MGLAKRPHPVLRLVAKVASRFLSLHSLRLGASAVHLDCKLRTSAMVP